MRDLFLTIPKEQRAEQLRDYGAYLADRDGELFVEDRLLTKREERVKKHEAEPESIAAMDRDLFRQLYQSFDPKAAASEEMLLLLALAKVNSAEAYGVELNFQRVLERATKEQNDTLLRILCEETYHTRILLSSVKLYGIEVNAPYKPPSALRILINGINTTPDFIALPLTLAGEIVATLMFHNLLALAPRVLKHVPEVRDSIEERLVEICADEHGHISYNRLHAGSWDLAQLRMILPMTARIMSGVFPEMVALGAFPVDVMRELPSLNDPKLIPAAVREQAYLA